MASYSIHSYDHESITLYIYGVSVGDALRVFCRYYDDESSSVYNQSFEATQTAFYYVITGLSPETKYLVNVGTKTSVSSDTTTWGTKQEVTTTAKPTVAEWDWTISNGEASASQTYTAYRAMTELSNCWWLGHFHYKVWNDLVNKAYEVITDRGGTWNTTYGTLSATRLSASDTEITSNKLNAVWWNLAQYITTGLSKMSAGDELTGDYFITLAEAINKTIWRG